MEVGLQEEPVQYGVSMPSAQLRVAVGLQFGNVGVLESVCCSGAVQEMWKYGSKGALLPAYHTTSTISSTMADQFTEYSNIFESGQDVPVNKQVSLFLELNAVMVVGWLNEHQNVI